MKRTHNFLKIAGIITCISVLMAAGKQETKSLFNKNNLDGWYAYSEKTGKINNATDLFKVEDGVIKLQGKNPGYLATLDTFKNYKLTAEYCWETDSALIAKAKKRNSGIIYHVPADFKDTLWPKGIQFQIKENCTGDFVLLQNTTMNVRGVINEPGKSVILSKLLDAELGVGQWNSIEIITKDGKCRQYLNGKLVNEGEEASVTSGRIVLQYEGYPVRFRNIFITKE